MSPRFSRSIIIISMIVGPLGLPSVPLAAEALENMSGMYRSVAAPGEWKGAQVYCGGDEAFKLEIEGTRFHLRKLRGGSVPILKYDGKLTGQRVSGVLEIDYSERTHGARPVYERPFSGTIDHNAGTIDLNITYVFHNPSNGNASDSAYRCRYIARE